MWMCLAFSTLRVYKKVITSHLRNYCKGSNLNGNQSEALKEMTDFIYIFHFNESEKCPIRCTEVSLKAFVSLVRDTDGMI